MSLARRPRFSRLSLAVAAAAALVAFDAFAARLALVVGNDAYQNATPLNNARNDAIALSKELEAAGFKVTRLLDASRDTLNDGLDAFLRKVEKGDEVVFFFSGHGSQPPQTGPFLLPVDIRLTGERAIQRDGLSLEQLTEDLNRRARFSLIIIDACRNDPFRETPAGRALPPGSSLGRIEPPRGSMVIMAASKGQQALDNLGRNDPVKNGVFTRELIKQMRTPGLSATEMLKRVRGSVEALAATVNHQQRPALMDESSSDFFFYPPGGTAPAVATAPPPAVNNTPATARPTVPTQTVSAPAGSDRYTTPLTATPPTYTTPVSPPRPAATTAAYDPQKEFDSWEAASRANTRAALEAFIAQYPEGRYTPQARQRVAGMAPAPVAAPAPAPAPARPAANNPQAEFEVWDRAVTSKRKADYEAYLAQYPNGRYVDLARAALKKL